MRPFVSDGIEGEAARAAETVRGKKGGREESEIMEWLSRKITVIYPVYETGLRRAEKQTKNGEKIGR